MKSKIKICGVISLEQAMDISKLKVDYLGFIINFPKSPRSLSVDKVANITRAVKKINSDIKFVGVFVDQSLEFVLDTIAECNLDVVQLHGNESIEYCTCLQGIVEVWKAVIVKSFVDVKRAELYKQVVNKVLLDAGRGSGREIDYNFLDGVEIDILAGGIGLENVKRIVEKFNPEIIDMNSKLESEPGKKDIDLVIKVISEVKDNSCMDEFC